MRALALLLTAASAFAAVDGTVVNRSTGKPQAGAVVTLFKLTQAGPQLIQATKTDAQGKFAIAQETGQESHAGRLTGAADGQVADADHGRFQSARL